MEQENKTIKLIDELPIGESSRGFKSAALKNMQLLCIPLYDEAQRLREELRKTDCPLAVKQRVASLNHVAAFLPVYMDMAVFASDNKFSRIINISPHFMHASPVFRASVFSYVEVYPTRFGGDETFGATFDRSFKYPEDDIFMGRYMGYEFCDTFGMVRKDGEMRELVVSVDTLGWPGVLEASGLESWDEAYANLAASNWEVLAFMPAACKPTANQWPGTIMTLFDKVRFADALCGLYLLSPKKAATSVYMEDIAAVRDIKNKMG